INRHPPDDRPVRSTICAIWGRVQDRPLADSVDGLPCDREQRMSAGKRPTLLVNQIICTDQDAMHWVEEDIGNLRVALNALVRLFRM
ncbi:MAG: hypothetical protein WCN98_13640, partial [Verrucomicrobiaceae bacterium]